MGTTLRARPIVFSPLGLFDTLEGTNSPRGSCYQLQNLIHDITTPRVWVCRAAAEQITTFPGFDNPTVVSLLFVIGTRVYGMIATDTNPGFDEPFSYDSVNDTFDTISGVSSGNVPATQAFTGPWTPPTADLIGVKIIVTHPGFSGSGANFFGVLDVANPAAPTWTAANTGTNALPDVPTAVANFNDRAYFAVNNQLWFSDALVPTTITNATNVLTCGDTSPLTALGKQSLSTTTGGIVAGLVAFKIAGGFFQVTGDISTPGGSNLVLAGPIGNTGCSAPRSVVTTPAGIFFMSSDGIRLIDFSGQLQAQPIPAVRFPFANAQVPSRAAAAYNNSVYRISLETIPNIVTGATAFADYWYDFEINQWAGPHTINYDACASLVDGFVLASNRQPGALYTSEVDVAPTDTFNEFGGDLMYLLQSSILPQENTMGVQALIEATIDIGFGSSATSPVTVTMVDATLGQLGQAVIDFPPAGAIWGSFIWGAANWGGVGFGLNVYNVDWPTVIVYKKAAVQLAGNSGYNIRLGNFWANVEDLNYSNTQNPA